MFVPTGRVAVASNAMQEFTPQAKVLKFTSKGAPMRLRIAAILCAFAAFVSSCSGSRHSQSAAKTRMASPTEQTTSSPNPTATASPAITASNDSSSAPSKSKIDVCSMLTSAEIKTIQGEPLKETRVSGSPQGGFQVSQCFFTLPTFTNSISLVVTQKGDGPGARNPRETWNSTFHGEKEREKERKGGEEGERSARPQNVAAIGDEAFWMANRVGGALYVLKGNSFIRVSIGGPADQATKINKSKSLAQKVLRRL
jgi:hypothetical protein